MTVLRFATHLWFDAQALEAAQLYTSLLPDSRIDRVGAALPGSPAGVPTTVDLTLVGQRYTFLNGGPLFPLDPQVSLQVLCDDQREVDRLWDALLRGGGQESRCGWLSDRFGLSWQIVPEALPALLGDPDPQVARRVVAAMMTMSRLDVAALEAAARA